VRDAEEQEGGEKEAGRERRVILRGGDALGTSSELGGLYRQGAAVWLLLIAMTRRRTGHINPLTKIEVACLR